MAWGGGPAQLKAKLRGAKLHSKKVGVPAGGIRGKVTPRAFFFPTFRRTTDATRGLWNFENANSTANFDTRQHIRSYRRTFQVNYTLLIPVTIEHARSSTRRGRVRERGERCACVQQTKRSPLYKVNIARDQVDESGACARYADRATFVSERQHWHSPS